MVSILGQEQVYQFLQKPISLAGAEGVIPTEKPASRVPREAALGAGGKCASGSVGTRESGGLAAGCGARTPPRPGPPRGEDELGPGGGAGLQKRGTELGRGGPARVDQGPPGVRGVGGGAPELGRPGGLWSLRRRLVRGGAGWAAVSPGRASSPVARRGPRRPLPETSNVPEPGEPSHPVRLPHSLSDEPEDHIFAVSSPVTMVTLPPQHSYLLWVQYDWPSSGVGKNSVTAIGTAQRAHSPRAFSRGRCNCGRMVREMQHCCSEEGGRRPRAKDYGVPPEAGKGEETDPPLEPWKEHSAPYPLILAQ
ncbi:uncharacterized protein [Physeter macrocephalus]|uniref:Uncharacterized protein n=1 Tax=Physeter macrocephalus TaxID=9755 RepID=A0A9W2WFY1_PHYMC|nr:uncharacterized protein LOC102979674 [Physeter catodon]